MTAARRAGEVLVELDPTASAAERDDDERGRDGATRIAHLTAILSDAPNPAGELVAPPGATPAQISLARQLIVSQVAGYRAKLAELDRQQAQHRAQSCAVAATVESCRTAAGPRSGSRCARPSMIAGSARSSIISPSKSLSSRASASWSSE